MSKAMRWDVFLLAAVLSVFALVWVFSGEVTVCIRGQTSEYLQKTARALDRAIDLEITLAVALIGGGIALLAGLKSGVPLTAISRTALLVAVMLFGQAILIGIFWRLDVANAWFNECLNIVSGEKAQRMFNGSLYFFLAGIGAAFVMLLLVINQRGGKTRA